MEGLQDHLHHHHHRHHHHHHHGHDTNHQNEGHQNVISSEDIVNANRAMTTDNHQQQNVTQSTLSVPTGTLNVPVNQTSNGIQAIGSFHSVSSFDSTAEMSTYFPNAQTPNLTPYRHQQEVGGQSQSTAALNNIVTTSTNTVNASPYIPVLDSIPVQRLSQPISASFMEQQQQQQQSTRSADQPQTSTGIPSYSSQIEGLSVSQAVVNDVLVDLQSKMINETVQQYQDGPSNTNLFEPLPPIYLRAPQPTIILQSDFHRLRAELRSRFRPPVVYRHPGGNNQFQQHRFQRSTFQTPRFPAPPQQQQQKIPPECYGQYQNAAYTNSDEYKTTTTTAIDDEQRKEKEERLFNQAESTVFNDANINANAHSAFDLQGLSNTPFDRYASPYQSSLFLSNLEDQQQDSEKTPFVASQYHNDEEIGSTSNMSVHSRQEITFDIDNCIARCFEAHRQRLARRRAARQARRARRHRPSGQQNDQQLYHTDQYQSYSTQPTYPAFDIAQQTQWPKRSTIPSQYNDVIQESTTTSTAHTSQKSYIQPGVYDYINAAQTTALPTDNQRYLSTDSINTQTDQIPFSTSSTLDVDAAISTDVQSSTGDYHLLNSMNVQETFIDSNATKYSSYQTVPSTTNLVEQRQEHTSFEFSSQQPYPSFSSMDSTMPSDMQQLTPEYYPQQQQHTSSQSNQNQESHAQASTTYDYTAENTFSQLQSYDYPNAEQQSYQYPYNIDNTQQPPPPPPPVNYDTTASSAYVSAETDIKRTELNQTYDFVNQALGSSDYYQKQSGSLPVYQTQETYGHPTGTFEYSKETYQSQEPIYNYQNTNQQSSQYPYNTENMQEIQQQDTYNYPIAGSGSFLPSRIDTNIQEQRQTYDHSNQAFGSSNYYQQQSLSIPPSQMQETFPPPPPRKFEYGPGSKQSQVPTYDYQNIEQQSFQYPYDIENIQQTAQKPTFDYADQALNASNYYQQPPMSNGISQDTYGRPSGKFEYDTGSTESQALTYDYQNIDQQSFQYPYNADNIDQQQSFDYTNGMTSAYVPPKSGIQQTSQRQSFDYSNQAFGPSNYYHQQPTSVPISQVQGTYDQATGSFEYLKDNYQSQGLAYDYSGGDQQSAEYSYNFDNIHQQNTEQQEGFNFTSEATTAYSLSDADNQQLGKRQTIDYTNQNFSTTDQYQQKPVTIPISQVYDSQLLGQRLSGASIPTGTVEYSRQAYYSQAPSSDEVYIQQHQQQEQKETFSINDYLKRFESETYIQQAGGQLKYPDDYQSMTTTSTSTPLTIQPNVDIYQSQGIVQNYDLQIYSNETTDSDTSQQPLPPSVPYEEDQQHLLQQATISKRIHEPIQPIEQRSEVTSSMYDTYSSLPPPPTVKEIDRNQQSVTTNITDFPAPPTPDDPQSFQATQQRISRTFTSIIPSTDEQSVYTAHQSMQPTSPSSNDQRTEDEIKEDEEIFDLRQCIAHCYEKYRESWNKEEQRQYEQQITSSQQLSSNRNIPNNQRIGPYQQMTSQQPITDRNRISNQQIGQYQQTIPKQPIRTSVPPSNHQFIQQSNSFLSFHCGDHHHQQQQPQPYFASGEIHYIDGWTQTPSLDIITQSNVVQHTHDQTPSSFDTKPYLPQLPTKEFATDSRGQQTIEYSPPLITQAHHVIPTIPSTIPLSSYEAIKHEQQQQVYDHSLPIPPHLSFNDTDYQPNLYFPSQITAQPRQYENIHYDKYNDDEQQQQRYRAHSEPASIQQDSLASNAPLLSISSQTFDQHPRRSISIPLMNQHESQSNMSSVRILDNGRAYETDAVVQRHIPRIDPKTGLCLVPCPEQRKYAHLPPHLRPELFCVELPPAASLPPVPPPPPAPSAQQQRWCVRCCCVPGRTLIKKVVYKQVEEDREKVEEKVDESSQQFDYESVIDQMATKITVRYGNSILEEGDAFVTGNYSEQLRVIDFPVYVSGKNDPTLTPLVPVK